MGLMEQATKDIQRILGAKNEFALDLLFEAPTGEVLNTTGHFFDISIGYDQEGNAITGNHAVCHVSMQPFVDSNYPFRRTDGVISMKDHFIQGTYANGSTKNFKALDVWPDDSIGMITIKLDVYAAD